MDVNIISFGAIKDITGSNNIVLQNINDTNQLVHQLEELYPALSNIKYAIAVDKKIVSGKTQLYNNATVAILPPFSGG